MSKQEFENVWDAIEDDPVKREIYKLRSELIHVITEYINANNLKQREVANLLGISQPRVSILMKGDLESFRLDTLVGFAVRCGHTVSIDAA
ncbi:MAG: helix-turn-helix domain-containing protein [Pseudomonadales bacterium]